MYVTGVLHSNSTVLYWTHAWTHKSIDIRNLCVCVCVCVIIRCELVFVCVCFCMCVCVCVCVFRCVVFLCDYVRMCVYVCSTCMHGNNSWSLDIF